MQRTVKSFLSLLSACLLAGCAATADERIGEAQGYGGTLRVSVTMDGDKIADVQVISHSETQNIGTRAIEALPKDIVSANTTEVDAISGATVTSNAIKAAVRDALSIGNATGGASASPDMGAAGGASAQPGVSSSPAVDGSSAGSLKSGMGMTALGRIGPGKDDAGTPVYSFNVVFAHGSFDSAGRVQSLDVDQLEVATPNYDGESMPHFSGFPGQGGYALWDDASGKTDGKTGDSEEDYLDEIAGWKTKRQRGAEYKLNTGTWAEQMDAYERLFTGKTVDEIEAWVGQYCSDANGRPLTAESAQEGDQEKYNALTDEEKSMLADVTTAATISLNDAHGDIIGAIRNAWENAQ